MFPLHARNNGVLTFEPNYTLVGAKVNVHKGEPVDKANIYPQNIVYKTNRVNKSDIESENLYNIWFSMEIDHSNPYIIHRTQ